MHYYQKIIKITNVHTETHLLLYVNQTGRRQDGTMKAMKSLIKYDVVYVSEKDFWSFIQELLRWKELCNTIKDQHLEDEIIDDQKRLLFDVLHISNFSLRWLHTLVLLEDCAKSKLLTNEKSLTNQLLTK